MSGFKRATVSISQEEYDRLRESEIRLRTLPDISNQIEQRINQESVTQLETNLSTLQERQARYEGLIREMDDYIRDLESETNHALADYEASAIQSIQQHAGTLWMNYNQLLSDYTLQFNEVIQNNHHELQRELSLVSRRMRKMAGDSTRKRQIASSWLSSAYQIDEFIRRNYAVNKFFPERFARLEAQLEQSRANLEVGLAEAVVVVSQQLYSAFSELRLDLEKVEQEWLFLVSAAREALHRIDAILDGSHEVYAIDLDGNELSYVLDVHAWAPGRLEEIALRVSDYHDYLEQNLEFIDNQTLKKWLSTDLPELNQAIEHTVFDARVFAINSQLRINIADLVVRALQDQGFMLSEAEYQTNDQRQAFDARLSNLDGNEVFVSVAPSGQAIGDNDLFIRSSDAKKRTERELQQRWQEISQSLHYYGLEIGNFAVVELGERDVPLNQGITDPPARKQVRQSSRTGSKRYGY